MENGGNDGWNVVVEIGVEVSCKNTFHGVREMSVV